MQRIGRALSALIFNPSDRDGHGVVLTTGTPMTQGYLGAKMEIKIIAVNNVINIKIDVPKVRPFARLLGFVRWLWWI